MSAINVDPEKLLIFANDLRAFNQHFEARAGLLKSKFNSVSEVWKDDMYKEFADEFLKTIKGFEKLSKDFKEKEPKLRGLAQELLEIKSKHRMHR